MCRHAHSRRDRGAPVAGRIGARCTFHVIKGGTGLDQKERPRAAPDRMALSAPTGPRLPSQIEL